MGKLLKLLRHYFTRKDPATTDLVTFVRAATGMIPCNLSLYKIALQHSSIGGHTSNERLEFLGDAVLSAVVAAYLFQKYPLKEEGFLTEIRARLVNRTSLNKLARKMHLDAFLQYDTSLKKNHGKFVYGNALEALIGAVYLDHGYEFCQKFITERLIGNYISLQDLIEQDTNFKSKIIEWSHKYHVQVTFRILVEKQYESYREFIAQVLIGEKIVGEGTGRTKKCAEQMAAQQALEQTKCLDPASLLGQ